MQYENLETAKSSKYSHGPVSTAISIIGGIFLILSLSSSVKNVYSSWSPTKTARACFRFPESMELPSNESVSRLILSSLFFGNDSFYFDAGDENTGTNKPIEHAPSSGESHESLPQAPIGEPSYNTHDIYNYDLNIVPGGYTALLPYDLSGNAKKGQILLSNTTAYKIDTENYLCADYPIKTDLDDYSDENPLVLIVHTHGTESYAPEGAEYISDSDPHRSPDTSKNMIAIGSLMAEILNESGIPTLHCETMHDIESYQRSYDLAADTIQKYLTEYPSIKYVFDVHRDAIVSSDGSLIRPLTLINGKRSAQIMLLVGTNEKGADHPEWETNFTVAAKLQERLTTNYEKFARPINIRGASFNEQFTPGSLLIEIGSAANTLSEAKTAARELTYTIANMIKEESQ